MNKTELKPKIFIEGFDKEYQYRQKLYGNTGISNSIELLYQGKTSEIPKSIANECLETIEVSFSDHYIYVGYLNGVRFTTGKYIKAIKAACNQEFCIIYKTN